MGRKRIKKSDEMPSVEKPVEHVQKDPAYNCPPCKGEGMVFDNVNPQGKICGRCRGTGKL